jgi:hypothetical protein
VGDEHDRLPGSAQPGDDAVDGQAALRVQPGGGFVEEQHLGLMHDRPGDHQPLRHPAGQLTDALPGGGAQVHPLQQAVCGYSRAGGPHPEVAHAGGQHPGCC